MLFIVSYSILDCNTRVSLGGFHGRNCHYAGQKSKSFETMVFTMSEPNHRPTYGHYHTSGNHVARIESIYMSTLGRHRWTRVLVSLRRRCVLWLFWGYNKTRLHGWRLVKLRFVYFGIHMLKQLIISIIIFIQ